MSQVLTNSRPTHDERDGVVYLDYTKRLVVNFSDLDATKDFYIPIDAGLTVKNITFRVATAFAGGGAEVVLVGDADDADGYITTAQLTVTSLGAMFQTLKSGVEDGAGVKTANGYAEGKHYASLGRIKLDFNSTSALTAGQLIVGITFDGYGLGPARDVISHA